MRRRLNVKLLAGLGIGSIVFMIGVHILHGYQVDKNADGLIRRADVAREAGDLDETIRLLGRYLMHRPEDAIQAKAVALDAKKNLIQKAESRTKVPNTEIETAIFLMEQAVRLKGFDPGLRREAADFWFKFSRYDYAIDNLEALKKLSQGDARDGEEKAEWTVDDQMQYISCLRATGTPDSEDKAITQLAEMLGLDLNSDEFILENAQHPEMLQAYQSLASLLFQKRMDLTMAEKTLNQMVIANSENYEAYLSRSRMIRFIRPGDAGKAIWRRDVEKAFELDSKNVNTLAAMSQMLIEDQEMERAKELVNEGLQKAETLFEKSALYNLLVQIYISDKDIEGAFAVLDTGIREVKHDRELLWKKSRLLLDEKRFDDVEKTYRPLEAAGMSVELINYLKARILMERDNDYHNSTKELARIRPLVPKSLQYDIDVYLSMGYGYTRQHDLRLETTKRIIAVRPDNLVGHENYIQTLMALGRNRDAHQYLQQLQTQLAAKEIELSPNLKLLEGQLSMKIGIDEASSEVAEGDMRAMSNKIATLFRDETIPVAQRQSIALEWFRRIKNPAKAKQIIDQALRDDPTSYPFWAVRLDYAESKEEAASIFAQMKQAVPEEYQVALMPIEAKLAVKYAPETVDATISRIEQNSSSLTSEQKGALFYELGILQLAFQKNREEGVRLLEKASSFAPKRIDILSTLYQEATEESNESRIDELVGRIRDITGTNDDTYRMAEAGRIVWRIENGKITGQQKDDSLGRARQYIETARTNRPEHIPLILLEARINLAEGDQYAAINSLKRAHGLQAANSHVIRMIAQIYKDLGDLELMNEWMEKLPLRSRSDRDKRVALNTLAMRRTNWTPEETKHAIELVDDVVPSTSEVPTDLLLRSQIYSIAKRLDVAEQAARRAIELDPKLTDAWTTLFATLVDQRKQSELQTVMQQAQQNLEEKDREIVMGRCFAMVRDYDRAAANFTSALQKDPDNVFLQRLSTEVLMAQNKTPEAVAQLQKILDNADPEKHPKEVQWARRSKARILGESGSYESFNEGLQLIEQNAVDGELGKQDLALWSLLCYLRPERPSWDRALFRLDKVSENRPLNDDELFMKARLYERYDDDASWQEAKQLTLSVLARRPGNKKVIENYVRWLLKRGELSEARRLATANFASDSVIRLRVELHDDVRGGRSDAALDKLKRLTPTDPQNAQQLLTLQTLAEISDELGQYNEQFHKLAQQQFVMLVRKVPARVLRLATALGLHGEDAAIKQGLQLCIDSQKQKMPSALCAGTAISILREHADKWETSLAAEKDRIGAWLEEIASANPDDIATQWRLAEFHDMVGNLDRVEVEYQKILDNPKFDNPIERGMLMNNLAYAMALNGNAEKPMAIIASAKRLLGPTSDVIDTEGYILLVRGDFETAIRRLKEAIKGGPATAQKYFHLALAYDRKGDGKNAANEWASALKFGLNKPKLPLALHDEFDKLSTKYGSKQL